MTTLENAREFLQNILDKDDDRKYIDMFPSQLHFDDGVDLIQDHSKHVLQQVISFLEANEKKPIRSIINELKGKV